MNIGMVSTRFAGIDGVSLEALKWAEVLQAAGHRVFWFSGLSDRPAEVSMVVAEAHFEHPANAWIHARIWRAGARSAELTRRIESLAAGLQQALGDFVDGFAIDLLVAENALAIPVHVPLGLAVARLLGTRELRGLAHHHDFFWERERFEANNVGDYLAEAFPPALANLVHVVINTNARVELRRRHGIEALLIPNVFDYAPALDPGADAWGSDLRAEIRLEPDDLLILQPTRIVPRKGIEHAIELVRRLADPRCKLVISHGAGDEGFEYRDMLIEMAASAGVDLRIIAERVGDKRGRDSLGQKIFHLWDVYPHADFVTYPSLYEGFGNALLETFYFRKPVLVNRYAVFVEDLAPLGFEVVEMDGAVTPAVVEAVRMLLANPDARAATTARNFDLAARHFGFPVLRDLLQMALAAVQRESGREGA